MTRMDRRPGLDVPRLAEAATEAAVILALVLAPTGWRILDGRLAVVLAAMLVALTFGGYALHAVTFDCLRLSGQRSGRTVERSDP